MVPSRLGVFQPTPSYSSCSSIIGGYGDELEGIQCCTSLQAGEKESAFLFRDERFEFLRCEGCGEIISLPLQPAVSA